MALREWTGIERDVSSNDSGGAHYVQNSRFWIDGELQRRLPVQRAITQNAGNGMSMFIAPTGVAYIVTADLLGNLTVSAI